MNFYVRLAILVLACSTVESRNLPPPSTRGRTFGNFGPFVKNHVETFAQSDAKISIQDILQSAIQFFADNFKIPISSIRVSSSCPSTHNSVTHVYFQQVVNGLEVTNGVGNMNVDENGHVISAASSFATTPAQSTTISIESIPSTPVDAVIALEHLLNLAVEDEGLSLAPATSDQGQGQFSYIVTGSKHVVKDIPAHLKYMEHSGSPTLRHVWQIEFETHDNCYVANIDSETRQVVQLIDLVSDNLVYKYNVYPLGVNDPADGVREVKVNPAHIVASPLGWHYTGDTYSSKTIGNNVWAQENFDGGSDFENNYSPQGQQILLGLQFNFPIDFAQEPYNYHDASITNLFYWNNVVHDLLYVYGFDEKCGNFQVDNLGRGGVGGDAVLAQAQDGSGTNNANFLTPADGTSGRMRMYLFTKSTPGRDGDLDSGIIFHEYGHGLSNRLTGGASNVNCLGSGQPGGMGEGWGDLLATIVRVTPTTNRNQNYAMGAYSFNDPAGIRKYLYSTSMTTNPSTYSYIFGPDYTGVHDKGEVWAVILYEVFWNLVDKHHFNPNWYYNGLFGVGAKNSTFKSLDGQEFPVEPEKQTFLGGNNIMFQLVLDGMKFQPCNPTFIQARDAILLADVQNYGGSNKCEIWKGFAKRGLGVSATFDDVSNTGQDGFDVPANCV